MTDFPILLYTSSSEIPTPFIYLKLEKGTRSLPLLAIIQSTPPTPRTAQALKGEGAILRCLLSLKKRFKVSLHHEIQNIIVQFCYFNSI